MASSIVASDLETRGIPVLGAMVGTLIPALDTRGISLTFTKADPSWLQWWTRSTDAPGFPRTAPLQSEKASAYPVQQYQADTDEKREWSDPALAEFESWANRAHGGFDGVGSSRRGR